MTPLKEARERFERAVKAGSYAEAERCLLACTEAVNATLAEEGPGGQRYLEAVGATLDLLRWANRAVRASRAHTVKELARLSASRSYRARPPAPAAKIQLVG